MKSRRRNGGKELFKEPKAKSDREDDNPVVKGGTSTTANTIIDRGCTYSLKTKAVTDAIKIEIKPLTNEFIIIETSGKTLMVLGTVKMHLETEVLGSLKMVEAAVIEGEVSKED